MLLLENGWLGSWNRIVLHKMKEKFLFELNGNSGSESGVGLKEEPHDEFPNVNYSICGQFFFDAKPSVEWISFSINNSRINQE